MKEINLKLKTIVIDCEISSIKADIIIEEPDIDIVIPKKIRKKVEKLLIEELKNSKQK
jgi:hypothetical protein